MKQMLIKIAIMATCAVFAGITIPRLMQEAAELDKITRKVYEEQLRGNKNLDLPRAVFIGGFKALKVEQIGKKGFCAITVPKFYTSQGELAGEIFGIDVAQMYGDEIFLGDKMYAYDYIYSTGEKAMITIFIKDGIFDIRGYGNTTKNVLWSLVFGAIGAIFFLIYKMIMGSVK